MEPDFLIGFLDSSIESLKLSKDDEINGVMARDELIEKLVERKRNVEYTLKKKLQTKKSKAPDTPSTSQQTQNGDAYTLPTKRKGEKVAKKSLSSSAVSQIQPPINQPIQESASMNALAAKLDDMSSEVSDPTHTTTSGDTSSEITTISRHDEGKVNAHPNNTNIPPTNASGDSIGNNNVSYYEDDDISHTQQFASTSRNDPWTVSHAQEHIPNAKRSSTIEIRSDSVYQMVDAIRQNTNLSHEQSCVALRTVLSEMENILPRKAGPYLDAIAVHLGTDLVAPDHLLGETYDARRLRAIFADLADCKNDSEQRTWMLHEDESEILQYMQDLTGILQNADPRICCHEMSCDHYQSIINLVQYYQMETRWSIRKLLLLAFKSMCDLDVVAVDILLGSVLPTELVQEMYSNSANVERLRELAKTLTMIFSLGLRMPVTHEEQLDAEFVKFMLKIIETPPVTDSNGILPVAMITLLLSFNLQFDRDKGDENPIIEALQSSSDMAKTLTEKLLLLINREEDPVRVLKHPRPDPINSVLKMTIDLFNNRDTASLFYTSDCKVLIDILVRQLTDLSAGVYRRNYLELCRRILRNTDYLEHNHRKADLMKIFTGIFLEDGDESVRDQQLVREIANESQIFKN